MHDDGSARLDFIQNTDFKFLELLSLDFVISSEDVIRQNIAFRYSLQRTKTQVLQNKLREVDSAIKSKNPVLLRNVKSRTNSISTNHALSFSQAK